MVMTVDRLAEQDLAIQRIPSVRLNASDTRVKPKPYQSVSARSRRQKKAPACTGAPPTRFLSTRKKGGT